MIRQHLSAQRQVDQRVLNGLFFKIKALYIRQYTTIYDIMLDMGGFYAIIIVCKVVLKHEVWE
jgi:hypothetical protein